MPGETDLPLWLTRFSTSSPSARPSPGPARAMVGPSQPAMVKPGPLTEKHAPASGAPDGSTLVMMRVALRYWIMVTAVTSPAVTSTTWSARGS